MVGRIPNIDTRQCQEGGVCRRDQCTGRCRVVASVIQYGCREHKLSIRIYCLVCACAGVAGDKRRIALGVVETHERIRVAPGTTGSEPSVSSVQAVIVIAGIIVIDNAPTAYFICTAPSATSNRIAVVDLPAVPRTSIFFENYKNVGIYWIACRETGRTRALSNWELRHPVVSRHEGTVVMTSYGYLNDQLVSSAWRRDTKVKVPLRRVIGGSAT